MSRFLTMTLFALLLATPALAEEPTEPKLGEGAIAESCVQQFPSDPAAAKACEVTIWVLIDRQVGDQIYHLFRRIEDCDVKIAELEVRLETEAARLDATKKDKKRR